MIASFKRKKTVDNGLQDRIAGITTNRRKVAVAETVDDSNETVISATIAKPDLKPAKVTTGAISRVTEHTQDVAPGLTEHRFHLHRATAREELVRHLSAEISADRRAVLDRGNLAKIVDAAVSTHFVRLGITLNAAVRRGFVTEIMQQLSVAAKEPNDRPPARCPKTAALVESARAQLHPLLLERMDVTAASEMPRPEFEARLAGWVTELLAEINVQLNFIEQRQLIELLTADMLGLGPLDPLVADDSITDIMVNGPNQIYVERGGKIELTPVKFRNEQHLMSVCTRIVTRVRRRLDEVSAMVDARLPDGSRVNIIAPPLAVDGVSLSIRKFSKKTITLDSMVMNGSISLPMATLLKIAARSRLNILISGGTGSGKTTLLNALSRLIDSAERTVTIEDAAELQLQQPHVVRLETRTANLEGGGEVTQRDLLRNALRMRPDRIIIGECRGDEAFDMLQAMNTGHDGSMSTIHANNPREALGRLESMIGVAGTNLPGKAVRTQIASAVDLICQVSRMRDGVRRVTQISEVVGMEGDIITTQDLFTYEFQGLDPKGKLQGSFRSGGIRPMFLPRAEYFGLEKLLLEVV